MGTPHVEEMAAAARNRIDIPDPPLVKAYYALADRAGNPNIQWWPLAMKAEFTAQLRSKTLATLEVGKLDELSKNGDLMMVMIAAAHYAYGLPDERAIPQEQALESAQAVLQETFGYSSQDVQGHDRMAVYYDVTAPDKQLWRFVFQPQQQLGMMVHRIEIDAYTGDKVSAEAIKYQPPAFELDKLPDWINIF